MNVEGRERFFRAIAERIDVDRVEEVHVFPAIRQGGRESGVAVVTLRPEAPEIEVVEQSAVNDAEHVDDVESIDDVELVESVDDVAIVERTDDVEIVDDVESLDDAEGIDGADDADDSEGAADADAASDVEDIEELVDVSAEAVDAPLPPPRPPRRFTVLRAHYRLQLKGPDRGKWEVGVVEEADAPAATVDEVVRGVHERAGGWSVEGPERLTGPQFRAALAEGPWSATR